MFELLKDYSKAQRFGNIERLYETQKTLAVYHSTTSLRIVWPLKNNIVETVSDANLCLEWIDLAVEPGDLYEIFILNQHADTVFSRRTTSSIVNISLRESLKSVHNTTLLIGVRKVNESTQISRIHELEVLERSNAHCPKMKASNYILKAQLFENNMLYDSARSNFEKAIATNDREGFKTLLKKYLQRNQN